VTVFSYESQPLEQVGEGPVALPPHVGEHQEADQVPCNQSTTFTADGPGRGGGRLLPADAVCQRKFCRICSSSKTYVDRRELGRLLVYLGILIKRMVRGPTVAAPPPLRAFSQQQEKSGGYCTYPVPYLARPWKIHELEKAKKVVIYVRLRMEERGITKTSVASL
jgi:hypothetical protein